MREENVREGAGPEVRLCRQRRTRREKGQQAANNVTRKKSTSEEAGANFTVQILGAVESAIYRG